MIAAKVPKFRSYYKLASITSSLVLVRLEGDAVVTSDIYVGSQDRDLETDD